MGFFCISIPYTFAKIKKEQERFMREMPLNNNLKKPLQLFGSVDNYYYYFLSSAARVMKRHISFRSKNPLLLFFSSCKNFRPVSILGQHLENLPME